MSHEHLIAILENALPVLRDAEMVADYLGKLGIKHPLVFQAKRNGKRLQKKLACYGLVTAVANDKGAVLPLQQAH